MKRYVKYLIFTLFLVSSLSIWGTRNTSAATEWDTDTTITTKDDTMTYSAYLSKDGKECWIYKITPDGDLSITTLDIPDSIQNTVVTKIGFEENTGETSDYMNNIFGIIIEPYHQVDGYDKMPKGIKNVHIPSTVKEITLGSFCGFRDLKSIIIPDGVEDIRYGTFYNCKSLQKVVFPANLKTIAINAFQKCKSLDTIEISKNSNNFICYKGMLLTKDKSKLVWVQPKIDKITIPSSVKTIGNSATYYSYVKKVHIPASVSSIEDNSLNGNYISSLTIANNNKRYGKSQNCIYSKKTKRLVVVLCTNGEITLPKEVKYLTNNVSIAGKPITKLTIPSTFKGFKENWYYNIKYNIICSLYFKSSTPPKAEKNSFSSQFNYYVPKKALQKYLKWYYDTENITDPMYADTEFKAY
ncbi:leucine-rich repeat domain-containing protein [Anaerosporobacter sp.]